MTMYGEISALNITVEYGHCIANSIQLSLIAALNLSGKAHGAQVWASA